MPKKEIIVKLKNNYIDDSINTQAIISDNKIKYKEKDNTKVILDLNNKELIRENNELYMKYIFNEKKETDGIIDIKELNRKILLKIKTKKYRINNNIINIEFEIENDIFTYEIEEIK